MRRLLYILILCFAASMASAMPVPDNFLPQQQRIENVAQAGPSVQGGAGQIVLVAGNSDATFSIYSITGQLIKSVKVTSDQRATVDVPKGFYIVKCSNQWSRKVVVR